MLTTFTLFVVAGDILRLALGWGLHRRYQLDLSVPEALALALLHKLIEGRSSPYPSRT